MNNLIGKSDIFSDGDDDHNPLQLSKKAKYANPSLPQDPLQDISQSELEKFSHEDLVTYTVSLQATLQKTLTALEAEKEKSKTLLKEASKKAALVPKTANNVAAAQSLSPTQVAERADKLADMCAKGIKKQMKWQVYRSCLILMTLNSPRYPIICCYCLGHTLMVMK